MKDHNGSAVTTNKYDGLNRRIVRTNTSETRHFYYNRQWQVLEERVGTATTADKQYVYHPQYVDAVAMRLDANDDEHYFLYDANFNVTAVVDGAGAVEERYTYSPYGKVTVLESDFSADPDNKSDVANDLLYTGRRRDPETGLQLNRNRFYASHLGRWVNRDPIGYEGGDANLYGYAGGMPTRFFDPSGFVGEGWWPDYLEGEEGWIPDYLQGREGWVPDFLWGTESPYGQAIVGGAQGGAAAIDGALPFIDPLDSYYDKCDPVFQFSHTLGGISRDVALAAAIPNLGQYIRNPFFYELGSTTVPGRIMGSIGHMGPIQRGQALYRHLGPRGFFLGGNAPGQFGTTIWTGLTPGGYLAGIGAIHVGDAIYENSTDQCGCD